MCLLMVCHVNCVGWTDAGWMLSEVLSTTQGFYLIFFKACSFFWCLLRSVYTEVVCGVCIRVCVITQVFPFLTKCFSCVDTILNLTRCCLFLCFWLFWLCVFIFKYVLYIRTLQIIHSIENRQWPSFTSSVLTRSVPKLHIQMLHNKSLPHQYFCT